MISFLSDYGLTDEFVGVCKAVMAGIAPGVQVIDVTHEIPPYDVRAGALTLARSVGYLPAGVVLAVVDPGVGTDRRAVAVEVASGHFVGPDNGLLAPAVAMLGGARRAVALTNTDYQLSPPGPTFSGRDVFSPAAAHLAIGVSVAELGDEIDPFSLVPGMLPVSVTESGMIMADVLWVDRFGNLQTNVDPEELDAIGLVEGSLVEVSFSGTVHHARRTHTYADAKPGELVVMVDSYGLVSITMDKASAAEATRLRTGSALAFSTPQAGSQ